MVPPPAKYTHGLRFSNEQHKKVPFIVCRRGRANTGGFKYRKKLSNIKKNPPNGRPVLRCGRDRWHTETLHCRWWKRTWRRSGEWVKGLGENALNTTKCGRTLLLVGGTRLRAGHEGGDGGDRSNNAKTAPIFLRGGCGVVV